MLRTGFSKVPSCETPMLLPPPSRSIDTPGKVIGAILPGLEFNHWIPFTPTHLCYPFDAMALEKFNYALLTFPPPINHESRHDYL